MGTQVTRHILFHVAPLARFNGEAWRWNVKQIKEREHLFNGKKIAAVLTPSPDGYSVASGRIDNKPKWDFDPVRYVTEALGNTWKIFTLQNDPTLREVVSWGTLWQELEGCEGNAFYCHAKGVSHGDMATRLWTQLMYSSCLDCPELIDTKLQQFPILGSFKKIGKCFEVIEGKGYGSKSSWHYSGTFFWVRLEDFFRRKWLAIERFYAGTEAWPGIAYKEREGGCLLLEMKKHQSLYNKAFIEESALPAYFKWRAANLQY